ncbi:Homeodomain-like protein [Cokeromyces recurvatus]|uniref:Homeodomain-like protein n=1 Tax=Cokeromyces recurvatus TaxID=90255 RepID=UPI00221ECA4C|nr:Homeodomain-like protein [Cokeromyces recurvatus]KAI7900561.1 Homeodomain-like protein [Cokeromyces recurvatus]
MGAYYDSLLSPSILTTTRSHSIKRNRRPSTYSRWTNEEDELLRQAVQSYGPHKWALIASHVPNRTPMQCSTRWLGALNPNIHKGRWTENEDAVLRYSVLEYANRTDAEGRTQPIPWNKIAERISNRTGIQCQARWTEALDPYVRKGKWGADEDSLLVLGVKEFGRCWIRIAETIPGRTQRQCRTRWMQLKYKEDRQHQKYEIDEKINTTKESSVSPTTEDTSSQQSYNTSDEEEEEVDMKQSQKHTQQQPQLTPTPTPNFFTADDFNSQLSQQQHAMMMLMLDDNNNNNNTNMNQTLMSNNNGNNGMIDFLKEDELFLATDWNTSLHQQTITHNTNFYL